VNICITSVAVLAAFQPTVLGLPQLIACGLYCIVVSFSQNSLLAHFSIICIGADNESNIQPNILCPAVGFAAHLACSSFIESNARCLKSSDSSGYNLDILVRLSLYLESIAKSISGFQSLTESSGNLFVSVGQDSFFITKFTSACFITGSLLFIEETLPIVTLVFGIFVL